jgi:NDP-sugar pyrophosphorylase family protein
MPLVHDNIDVVILCGGLGTRLENVVTDRPKSMALINNYPFMDILIGHVNMFGYNRFILCTGHMSEFIESYYETRRKRDHSLPISTQATGIGTRKIPSSIEILISKETCPLGTAGAIKNAEKLIHSRTFFVLNGDSFCPVNLTMFLDFHRKKSALLSLVTLHSKNPGDDGQIVLDDSGIVQCFTEKAQGGNGLISAGIYLFEKDVLKLIPSTSAYSLEHELFPNLIGKKFYGFLTEENLIDIGTPERLMEAKKLFYRL